MTFYSLLILEAERIEAQACTFPERSFRRWLLTVSAREFRNWLEFFSLTRF